MSTPQIYQDHDKAVSATTWAFASLSAIVVTAQVVVKRVKHRTLELGDWLLVAAAIVALGQSIAVTEAVNNGLGRSIAAITMTKRDAFEKSLYAAQILYVCAVGLAKTSAAYASSRISTVPKFVDTGRVLMLFGGLWTVTGILAAALQCDPFGRAWQIVFSTKCFDRPAFLYAIGAMDWVFDVAIAVWCSHLASSVNISRGKKVSLLLAFWSRLLSAPFLIARFVLVHTVTHNTDTAKSTGILTILSQAQMSIAIFTTTLPYLRLWASKFEDGRFTTNMRIVVRRRAARAAALAPLQIRAPDRRFIDPTARAGRHISVRGSMAHSLGGSSLGSAKMIINKMTSFWVEEERAPERDSRPPVPRIQESFLEDA